jgi:hypothetical protein
MYTRALTTVLERYATIYPNQGLPPNLYFWRDHTGHEIDLLAEWNGQL